MENNKNFSESLYELKTYSIRLPVFILLILKIKGHLFPNYQISFIADALDLNIWIIALFS